MPLEVRELLIKASIQEPAGRGENGASWSGAHDREAIIADCVEEVMELLRDRSER